MTLEKLQTAKNLFLIFPAGCGGNHLANMLSMDPLFAHRFTINPNRYNQVMIRNYIDKFSRHDGGTSIAHFSDLENLQTKFVEQYLDKILSSQGIYIFCSHAFEYYNQSKLIQNMDLIDNRIFCLFSVPTGKNKIVKTRMDTGTWSNGEHVDTVEYAPGKYVRDYYDPESFCELNKVSMDQITLIDTDKFYTVEGYDYLEDVIYENFRIKLNPHCRTMHTWYIKYYEFTYRNA